MPRELTPKPPHELPPFQRFLDAQGDTVWRFLRGVVGGEEAEDCFQETFIAALRAYPGLRGDGREHNLRAWVLTIAHHKAMDAHRARARRAVPVAEVAELEAAQTAGRGAGAEHMPGRGERDETLWDAVGELPARQRSAVVLRYVVDLPHREIAAAIGCSEEAARRSLHEGLLKLRKAVAA